MIKSKYKRWQWWVCVVSLSPLIVFIFGLSFIGSIFCFVGEKLNFIEYAPTPKLLIKYVNWGSGK